MKHRRAVAATVGETVRREGNPDAWAGSAASGRRGRYKAGCVAGMLGTSVSLTSNAVLAATHTIGREGRQRARYAPSAVASYTIANLTLDRPK